MYWDVLDVLCIGMYWMLIHPIHPSIHPPGFANESSFQHCLTVRHCIMNSVTVTKLKLELTRKTSARSANQSSTWIRVVKVQSSFRNRAHRHRVLASRYMLEIIMNWWWMTFFLTSAPPVTVGGALMTYHSNIAFHTHSYRVERRSDAYWACCLRSPPAWEWIYAI
jgi:hypothetical protein